MNWISKTAENFVLSTAVPCPLFPSLDHAEGGLFHVVGLSEVIHTVYKHCGDIEVPAVFTGGVVTGEGVVEVVEPLPHSAQGHAQILRGVDPFVIGFSAPQVGETVHWPCGVQQKTVPQNRWQEEGIP